MNYYAISGLGADKRVFEKLDIADQLIHLDWIKPLENESIESYAKRLASSINKEEPFVLIGLSFGGMIASEINKFLTPQKTILISSCATAKELPSIFLKFGEMDLLKHFTKHHVMPPTTLANVAFGAKDKQILDNILTDTEESFLYWSVEKIITWENDQYPERTIQVCGKRDKTLPPKNKPLGTIYVDKGEHFMIYDLADEVSAYLHVILD
jgi:hypothetical protein